MTKLKNTMKSIIFFMFIAAISADSIEQICTQRMLSDDALLYGDCMDESMKHNTTLGHWPLKYLSVCSPDIVGANAVCAPPKIMIESLVYPTEVSSQGHTQTKYYEYLIVKWTACAVGISDTKGFLIKPRKEHENSHFPCFEMELVRNLTVDDVSYVFSAPILRPVEYNKPYAIEMEATPMTSFRYFSEAKYISSSCITLNKHDVCVCSFDEIHEELLDKPFVQFVNNSVYVTIKNFTYCPDYYSLTVFLKIFDESQYIRSYSFELNELQTVEGDLIASFANFYPVPKQTLVEVTYILSGYSPSKNLLHRYSKRFQEKSPIPNLPIAIKNITVDDKIVTVSFDCFVFSEPEATLLTYTLTLSKHEGKYKTVHSYFSKNATCKNSETKVQFFDTTPGYYSIKLRQIRPSPFAQQPWSAFNDESMFHVKSDSYWHDKLAIIISTSVLLLMLVILIGCNIFIVRNKKCRACLTQHIPKKLTPYVERQTELLIGSHKPSYVWIVWKSEGLTKEMEIVHAENVRTFATYLSVHCGVEVGMDQFDQSTQQSSFSAWLVEMHRKAEVVLFIIPQNGFDAPGGRDRFNQVGNFNAVFRYFEKDIYSQKSGNKIRFASILFPYSAKNDLVDSTKCLLKLTNVYNALDDIDDLYFFIQGWNKFNMFRRANLPGINKKEFLGTTQGKKLNEGFNTIKTMIDSHSRIASIHSSRDSNLVASSSQSRMMSTEGSGTDTVIPALASEPNNHDSSGSDSSQRFLLVHSPPKSPIPLSSPPPLEDIELADVDPAMLLINSRAHETTGF